MRQGHIYPTDFGLYNKYKKINFAPMSKNRILEMEIDFNENNFVIDNREGTKKIAKSF